MKWKKIYIVILSDLGIGDELVFTSSIDYLHKKENANFVIMSLYPDVFHNLNGISKNIKIKNNFFEKMLYYFLESSMHSNIISYYGGNIYYKRYGFSYKTKYGYYGEILKNNKLYLRDVFLSTRKDFLKKIKVINHNPVILFTNDEIKKFNKKFKKIIKSKYSIIMSGTSSVIKSKNINPKKINTIIKKTNKKIKWIQIGTNKDKLLENIFLDLRDKTSLREMFFLISKSNFILTPESISTHIGAAFKIPCISIYTGYHYPEISLYKTTIPIVPNPLPKCAYCFKRICPYSKNPNFGMCEKNIKTADILKEIKKL